MASQPALSKSFLRGSFAGQLNSVYKRRNDPDVVIAYATALRDEVCQWPSEPVTPAQLRKLAELNLARALPEHLRPAKKA